MSELFAKIFETPDYGQILVLCCEGPDGSEVRFYARPPDMLACSVALVFDTDIDRAENYFKQVDERQAREVAEKLFNVVRDLGGEGEAG